VGYNDYGSITTNYSTGTVTGDRWVGGLVGCNDYDSITNCYSTGMVNATVDFVGGLVGSNFSGSITTSYSTGAVTGVRFVGGFVGYNFGSITSSFWDMETSGQVTSSGGTGLTTAEMQNIDTFFSDGWDFNDEILNGTCDYWQISPGDYPQLFYHPGNSPVMPEGLGTAQKPYLIRDARDLGTMWFEPLAHYRLEASVDLSVITWSTAVIPWFGGTFDGNGYVISNLHIKGGGYLGLFGQLGFEAKISSLGLEAVNVDGNGNCIGGLAGSNYEGSITTSYSKGTVSGDERVGGLVGGNNGSITASYSTGSVSGNRYIGGLVGSNDGSITTSYSTGKVIGGRWVGGLVGASYGDIATSFWDIQTSGLAGSDGGVGLTTAEMMDPYMLGLNGFANDPNWILDAGLDYPRLAWEGTVGQIIAEPNINWMEGLGTAQNPYMIDTADQLIILSKASILWDKRFVLSANIDLDPNLPDGQVFSQAIIPKFTGVCDGNDHVIHNLVITGGSHLGLFGRLGSGAVVNNLGVVDVNITGTGDYIGGLVGANYDGSITSSYSTGTVSGYYFVGGLVGGNNGSITNCYSTGMVNGTGGYVGGFVGYNFGSITAGYSNGTVSGDDSVGGLVGSNDGSITTSYSTGAVSGDLRVGGLVGKNNWFGSITNCYSTVTVSGDDYVGGLVGSNDGSITTSYSTGTVSGYGSVGGLVGSNDRSRGVTRITSSFWDVETSDQATSAGGTGLTTAEMQTASTFLDAGWDFVHERANGTKDIWWILEGLDYPCLWWELIFKN